MASNFAYLNTRDLEFILQEWLPTEKIFGYKEFVDYYSKDDVKSVLDPVRKMCKELLEPANEDGDKNGVKFVDGKVITPPTFGPLFHKLQAEGWGTSNLEDGEDSMVLPNILWGICNELFGAASPMFMPYIGLTTGAAELVQAFASEELRAIFLPKMMDGTWAGTMCLTEPTAGSDVGDILSKAYPTDDPRIYKIKGNKIFITGGDNDFTENIIHLYMARIEGAAAGTAGISLFIVPKYWVNEDGSLIDNDVQTVGTEHKMGQHGSCTAALSLGENGKCRGWLLGKAPGEDGKAEGMAQMFQCMNFERMATAYAALSCVANAGYNARDYAKDRIQGRNPKGERVAIINHEDIKRALLSIKAHVEVMRGMIHKTFFMFDVRKYDPDPAEREAASDFIDIVTPLCKAYTSDEGWGLIAEAIQTYGGYGYTEDYPVAQIARDFKVYSIWEGTSFIQSMDLVGRKWRLKKGSVYGKFIKQIKAFCAENQNFIGFEKDFANLGRALVALEDIHAAMDEYLKNGKYGLMPLYARRILTATSIVFGAWCILDMALIADRQAKELSPEHYDYNFYIGKVMSARYYLRNVVPSVWNIAEIVRDGDISALEIPIESFDF